MKHLKLFNEAQRLYYIIDSREKLLEEIKRVRLEIREEIKKKREHGLSASTDEQKLADEFEDLHIFGISKGFFTADEVNQMKSENMYRLARKTGLLRLFQEKSWDILDKYIADGLILDDQLGKLNSFVYRNLGYNNSNFSDIYLIDDDTVEYILNIDPSYIKYIQEYLSPTMQRKYGRQSKGGLWDFKQFETAENKLEFLDMIKNEIEKCLMTFKPKNNYPKGSIGIYKYSKSNIVKLVIYPHHLNLFGVEENEFLINKYTTEYFNEYVELLKKELKEYFENSEALEGVEYEVTTTINRSLIGVGGDIMIEFKVPKWIDRSDRSGLLDFKQFVKENYAGENYGEYFDDMTKEEILDFFVDYCIGHDIVLHYDDNKLIVVPNDDMFKDIASDILTFTMKKDPFTKSTVDENGVPFGYYMTWISRSDISWGEVYHSGVLVNVGENYKKIDWVFNKLKEFYKWPTDNMKIWIDYINSKTEEDKKNILEYLERSEMLKPDIKKEFNYLLRSNKSGLLGLKTESVDSPCDWDIINKDPNVQAKADILSRLMTVFPQDVSDEVMNIIKEDNLLHIAIFNKLHGDKIYDKIKKYYEDQRAMAYNTDTFKYSLAAKTNEVELYKFYLQLVKCIKSELDRIMEEDMAGVAQNYPAFKFLYDLPDDMDYLARGNKGGLWGLTREAYEYTEFSDLMSKENMFKFIVKYCINNEIWLRLSGSVKSVDKDGNPIIRGSNSIKIVKRRNQQPPYNEYYIFQIEYSKSIAHFEFAIDDPKFSWVLERLKELYTSVNMVDLPENYNPRYWINYIETLDDVDKLKALEYLENCGKIVSEIKKHFIHLTRGSRGGLWGLKK